MNEEDNILEMFNGFTRHFGEVLAGNPGLFTCYKDERIEGDESVVRRFFIDMEGSDSLVRLAFIYNTETGHVCLVRTHYANPEHIIYEATSRTICNIYEMIMDFISDMGEWFKIEIEKLDLKRRLLELDRKQSRIFEEQFGWD